MIAGRLFVGGATGIAGRLRRRCLCDRRHRGGAVGTSLPELATVLLSRLRGHDDIGAGTLFGSNLFNGMAIVGVAATIHPISAPPAEVFVALVMGALSLLLMIPGRDGVIGRGRGVVLLAAYAVFVATTVAAGHTA